MDVFSKMKVFMFHLAVEDPEGRLRLARLERHLLVRRNGHARILMAQLSVGSQIKYLKCAETIGVILSKKLTEICH